MAAHDRQGLERLLRYGGLAGTMLVSVGSDGSDRQTYTYTSCDGKSWAAAVYTHPAGFPLETSGLRGVGFGGGTYVAVGGGTVSPVNARVILWSDDGISWTPEDQTALCDSAPSRRNEADICTSCDWIGDVAWLDGGGDHGIFVAGGGNGRRLWSTDRGRTWAESADVGGGPYRRFVNAGRRVLAASNSTLAVVELNPDPTSAEPLIWHEQAVPGGETKFLAHGNGRAVATWYQNGGNCMWVDLSDPTYAWSNCNLPEEHNASPQTVVFTGSKFYLLSRDAPLESLDGETWTFAEEGVDGDFRALSYAFDLFVRPRQWSADLSSWQNASPGATHAYDLQLGAGSCR